MRDHWSFRALGVWSRSPMEGADGRVHAVSQVDRQAVVSVDIFPF